MILSRVRQRCQNTSEATAYALELYEVIENYTHKPSVPQDNTMPKTSPSQKEKEENDASDSFSQAEEKVSINAQEQAKQPVKIHQLN